MAEEMKSFWVHFHFPLGRNVRIPRPLADKFDAENINHVELYTSDGGLRVIRLRRNNNQVWLGSGWTEFKQSNNIEFRDSLYFMPQIDNVFEVVVFDLSGLEKNTNNAKKNHRPVYFFKKLKAPSSCAKLVLPDEFSSRFGRYLDNPMTLVGSNRLGQNKVTWSSNRNLENLMLLDGWRLFVDRLNIRRNDLVIFKFNWTPALHVDVLPNNSPWIDHFHTGNTEDPRDIYNEVREVFSVTLNNHSAKKGQPLYVPAKVANWDLMNRPKSIHVRLETGEFQQWHLIWADGKNECKFGRGWYEFKEKNDLQPGDVVTFGRIGMEQYLQLYLG